MKKSGILNRALCNAIAGMGHGDMMMIVDAGFPIPKGNVTRIDLAVVKDVPDICLLLEAITGEFIYEACYVAEEQQCNNPVLFGKIGKLIKRCPVTTVPHARMLETFSGKATVFVRSGSFEPWGNIVLVSGIDAPNWFNKVGVITPDSYRERAEYKEE